MNERIRELADRALAKVNDLELPMTCREEIIQHGKVYNQLFAELIVNDCCEWIDNSPTTESGQLILTKSFIIANLKGMYGIE